MNSSFLLPFPFPFLFLTSSYVPRSQLSGWLDQVAALNPVTYLLEGLRSLVSQGWGQLGQALGITPSTVRVQVHRARACLLALPELAGSGTAAEPAVARTGVAPGAPVEEDHRATPAVRLDGSIVPSVGAAGTV